MSFLLCLLTINNMQLETHLKNFMIHSNKIEWEEWINPWDILAAIYTVKNGIKWIKDILEIHNILWEHLEEDWVWCFRKCNVRVWSYIPPEYTELPKLMSVYFENYKKMTSWEAHNKFEKIHPFQDLNGRVWRLIWLYKAYDVWYRFEYDFLHKYYYQTLNYYD